MAIRQKNHPRTAAGIDGRRSRFFGSTFWQAYYVELTILGVTICIGLLRGLEWTLARQLGPARTRRCTSRSPAGSALLHRPERRHRSRTSSSSWRP